MVTMGKVKVRLVIADDHAILREGLKLLLESQPSFEVVGQASNGRELVAIVNEMQPDLVVTDVTMPQLNGYEMLEALWAEHPEHADVPFVLLSALVERKSNIGGIELKADNYLTKPIDFDMLLDRVAAMIGE